MFDSSQKEKQMKRNLLIILLSFPVLLLAQQSPLYTQYMLNDFVINPAIAGSKPFFPLRLNAREQWEGFENAPSTQSLSFHAPVGDGRVGLGGLIFQDNTKPTSRLGFMASYAYHIDLSHINSTFSLGASGMIYQYKIDQNSLTVPNPDLAIDGGSFSEIVPDASFGTYLYGSNYYLGASVFQLFETTFKEASFNAFGNNTGVRHYFFMGGYTAEVHKSLHVEPSILLKAIEAGPLQIDINTRVIFNRKFWTGISLRTDRSLGSIGSLGSMVTLLGINTGKLHLAYGFDYNFASIGNYTSGSHEVSIGVNIPDPRSRRHVYYWRY